MKKLIYAVAAVSLAASFSQAEIGRSGAVQAARSGARGTVLKEARADVAEVFVRIDSALAQAAREVPADAAKTLGGLCSSLPAASCAVVDDKGKITAIFPDEYKNLVGSDVSKQDHVAKILKTHKPVMGKVFTSLQGFAGVGIYQPVFSKDKKFSGAVGILVKPEVLLSGVLAALEGKDGFNFWVMDKAGRILYDPDKTQIGKMLFSDEIYSQYKHLRTLGKKIAARGNGEGEYEFYKTGTRDTVIKLAKWDSVGLYGAQWRLVAVRSR